MIQGGLLAIWVLVTPVQNFSQDLLGALEDSPQVHWQIIVSNEWLLEATEIIFSEEVCTLGQNFKRKL